ncbi:heterokaryon incompatibility protein-domain-containing protein [Apiospora saccharicola]
MDYPHTDKHVKTVLELMPGPARKESWYSQDRTLETLLCKFGTSLAKFEYDRIFALLGISSDAFTVFPPRYDWPVQWLVKNTIAFLLFGKLLDDDAKVQNDWSDLLPQWDVDDLMRLLKNARSFKAEFFRWAVNSKQFETAARLLELETFDVNQSSTNNVIRYGEEVEREVPLAFLAKSWIPTKDEMLLLRRLLMRPELSHTQATSKAG